MHGLDSVDDTDLPSEERLRRNFVSILTKGKKDNTYKFALARYLLHHASREDAGLDIPYRRIAEAFLEYYWHQECKYRIKQNFHHNRDPHVIQIIRRIFGGNYIRESLRDMPGEKRQQAVEEIMRKVFGTAKNKTSLVVPRFQMISMGSRVVEDRSFYDYDDDKKMITLRPEALEFFKKNRTILHKMVILEWASFLERINTLPRLVAKIQDYKARRGPLKKFRDVLAGHPGSERCFYCGMYLGGGSIHVDHFIPWSYVFEDELWNLVLSCPTCNTNKSDLLADPRFLERLIERNAGNQIPALAKSIRRLGPDEEEASGWSGRTWKAELEQLYANCAEYGFQVWEDHIQDDGSR